MKTNEEINIVDLWLLDNNYNPPIKVRGFKHLVQGVRWYEPGDGYLYIDPTNGAFVACNTTDTIFESYDRAVLAYEKKKSLRKNFVIGRINIYKKELEKLSYENKNN